MAKSKVLTYKFSKIKAKTKVEKLPDFIVAPTKVRKAKVPTIKFGKI